MVVLADTDLARAAAQAKSLGSNACAIQMDVRSRPTVRTAMDKVLEQHGGIDILVNNASVVRAAPLLECTDEDWDELLATNLSGVYHCS
ncbi:SDR family NAD(P)-dependent oxidoreductase, partial [Pelomicrobium sp. G1]|uniref:SDR family NAD(P)-dependent oxidoreductase n=1 Tax=Pelomicrobium sp. G1 TaxID=3452920 RepID=UPI003F761AA3